MRTTTRISATAAAAAVAALLTATPASAHTTLQSATPGIGATVSPPTRIVLTYADPVRLPQVIITDAAGRRHESGRAAAVDSTVTEQVAGTLPDGSYVVGWRVVAGDGHPVEGTYRFTVTGSTAVAPAAPGRGATATPSSSGTGLWWLGLGGLLLVGVGAGVVILRRGLKADDATSAG